MKKRIAMILMGCMLVATPVVAADITACTNGKGKAKLSDGPPKKCKAEVVPLAHYSELLALTDLVLLLAEFHVQNAQSGTDTRVLKSAMEKLRRTQSK
jgi:hypothetical protein